VVRIGHPELKDRCGMNVRGVADRHKKTCAEGAQKEGGRRAFFWHG
jgi:hypothetical protein